MRKIDLHTWARREHFEFFSNFNHPHFSICANVDLTLLYPFIKQHGFSLTSAILYLIARAANAIPEFRQRLRGGEVVEHDVVSPALTVLAEGDLFGFCTVDYCVDFPEFSARATRLIAAVRDHPTLQDPPGRDDLLFMTAIPWVSFTSFAHPMRLHPTDSIPRFAWGKYFSERETLKMPLSVQGHHALIDGIHMGKFYAHIEEFLAKPQDVLGAA